MSTITTKMSMLALFVCSFMLMSSECLSQKGNDDDGSYHISQIIHLAAQADMNDGKNACEEERLSDEECAERLKELQEAVIAAEMLMKMGKVDPKPVPTPPSPGPCNCPDLGNFLKNIYFNLEGNIPEVLVIDARTGKRLAVGSSKLIPSRARKDVGTMAFKISNPKFSGVAKITIQMKEMKAEYLFTIEK